MKKLLSALLIATMLMSIVCVSVSADEGALYIDENFTSMESFMQNFIAGAFYVEDGLLFGYNEARTFMSNYTNENTFFDNGPTTWLTYDSVVELAIAEDEFADPEAREICISYCNDNPYYEGRTDGRMFLNFVYVKATGEFMLTHGGVGSTSEEEILDVPVPMEIAEDGEFFKLGMSVSKGRVRCFYNDQLIFDFVDTANDCLIGHVIESPFLLWNTNNFVQVKNVKIASDGYLFPLDETVDTTVGTEAPVDSTEATEAPADSDEATEAPADSDEAPEAPADSNEAPEATEAPEADTVGTTGTQQPSTSTGDATFVVVAAMVAALGSALIVKKVRG